MDPVQLLFGLTDVLIRQGTLESFLVDEAHRAFDQAYWLMVLNGHYHEVQCVMKLAKGEICETPRAEFDDRWNDLLAEDHHNCLHNVDDLPSQLLMPYTVLENCQQLLCDLPKRLSDGICDFVLKSFAHIFDLLDDPGQSVLVLHVTSVQLRVQSCD